MEEKNRSGERKRKLEEMLRVHVGVERSIRSVAEGKGRGRKSEVGSRRSEEKDEHRTSNIERPTSNEKMKQRAEGQEQGTEVGSQRDWSSSRIVE